MFAYSAHIQTAATKVTYIGPFIYCERLFACGKSEFNYLNSGANAAANSSFVA